MYRGTALCTGNPLTWMRRVPPALMPGPLARMNGVPSSPLTSPTDENCGDENDTAPAFVDATVTCSIGTGHACSIVVDDVLNGSWNPTCTGVTPDANGPVIVSLDPATVACCDEPSSGEAPAAPSGRSIMIGPPISTRFRALLTISSM